VHVGLLSVVMYQYNDSSALAARLKQHGAANLSDECFERLLLLRANTKHTY